MGILPTRKGGPPLINVTFFGVRGSTPCPCASNRRYGGNTACVVVEAPGEEPIVFDLGTGLRYWGMTQPHDGTFAGTAFVSHLHFDHVQGLPFFSPADRVGARFTVYGPSDGGMSLADAITEFMRPPYFPVTVDQLRGDYRFQEVYGGEIEVGSARVLVRPVNHVGHTNGYRLDWHGTSIAYISDHQEPQDGSKSITPEVLELCEGADLLIHDAQYNDAEFAEKRHWGHCTVDYALTVARTAGVKHLALFHHDPGHDDAFVDGLLADARAKAVGSGVEVLAAAERLTLCFDGAQETARTLAHT